MYAEMLFSPSWGWGGVESLVTHQTKSLVRSSVLANNCQPKGKFYFLILIFQWRVLGRPVGRQVVCTTARPFRGNKFNGGQVSNLIAIISLLRNGNGGSGCLHFYVGKKGLKTMLLRVHTQIMIEHLRTQSSIVRYKSAKTMMNLLDHTRVMIKH